MLSAWWLHLLDGLENYVISPVLVAHITVIIKNIMILGYNYTKLRLNNPPDIFCEITQIGRLVAWITLKLAWTQELPGRD